MKIWDPMVSSKTQDWQFQEDITQTCYLFSPTVLRNNAEMHLEIVKQGCSWTRSACISGLCNFNLHDMTLGWQGCQNKPATGAFHRLFWILRLLLWMLVGQFWAWYWRNKMEIAAYFLDGTSYSKTYWQPWDDRSWYINLVSIPHHRAYNQSEYRKAVLY